MAARAAPDETGSWLTADEVREALRLLPPRQRAVMVLRYYEGLSEKEIAAALGIAPGTVKSQASDAIRTLRRSLPAVEQLPKEGR